ncbi:aminoglycoside 6-adenylyltransferase [Metabacillus sp. KIGAM252]|uniref:Aminoglycoside 6-adenylyltransferase n=1 Tax=Metabacillus flavus TaxID=2823519 RepID=A0ABS5LBF3_9BACI|nr:aminoglycoside 6-adenylyltransferase [Metabacillus flavus]MBS2967878.1 aminoglycoside 6-adenylyltransferase [Metabacillus flavus]
MRTEKEMFDLIIGTAERDHRIRAVYMNGSRTNPNAPKDIFQDYDIVYVVTETASFINDEGWIGVFGDLLILQEPDKMDQLVGIETDFDQSYAYLMLFTDGVRIDLHIETEEAMMENGYISEKLTVSLLDKDGILPELPDPSDEDYHIKKPSEPLFLNGCNEFWWCLQNVAKGIWRDELPYAKQFFEDPVRTVLNEMVSWWIGTKHGFQVSSGKMGKYFKKYLPESYWELYKETYSDGNPENMWRSVFAACELFQALAKEVADYFSFTYNLDEAAKMTNYLKRVKICLVQVSNKSFEKSPSIYNTIMIEW